MIWLLLAQLAMWERVRPPVLHQGFVQSCAEDQVLEHRVNGHLLWELHFQQSDFGLYAFAVGDHDGHADPLNLLSAPNVDSLQTFRGARQWTVVSLRLWVSVVRAGEAPEGCESFYVKVVRQ